jgi:inner membrane protein
MRWDVFLWGAATLLLFAAEALAPGAFMLWLGLAAVVVFVGVLLVPGLSLLTQVAAFVVLSFVSIQVYRTWFRGRVQIADALWDVVGPELPMGAPVRIVGADGMTLRVESAG